MQSMDEREPHEILNIPPGASMEQIKQAYKQMVLKWHPDRLTQDADKERAVNTFSQITNAYQTLIRDHEPTSSIGKSKIRTRLPTPVPSARESSSGSTTTSSMSSSRFLAPTRSSESSQTTLPSASVTAANAQPNINAVPVSETYKLAWVPVSSHDPWRRQDANAVPSFQPKLNKSQNFPSPSVKIGAVNDDDHNGKPKPPSTDRISFKPVQQADALGSHRIDALQPGPPLESHGIGSSGEWIYSLTLTLEDMFTGKRCRFCIIRNLLSGQIKNVIIEVDVPPGCHCGTRILCRGVGHELSGGKFQDIAFLIEEGSHSRFTRVRDDLFLDVRLPWTDSLAERPKRLFITGIDADDIVVFIDYPRDRALKGNLSVRGAGMPIWDGRRVCGRGNLVIRWEIQHPQTRVRQFLERLFHATSKTNRKIG